MRAYPHPFIALLLPFASYAIVGFAEGLSIPPHLSSSSCGPALGQSIILIGNSNRRILCNRNSNANDSCLASTSPLFSSSVSISTTSSTTNGDASDQEQTAPKPSRLQFFRQNVLPRLLFFTALFLSGYRLGVNTGGSAIIDSTTATVRRSTRRFPLLSSALIFFILRDLWRSIPGWAKPRLLKRAVQDIGILFGRSPAAAEEVSDRSIDADDISDFGNLGGKLSAVLTVIKDKMPKKDDGELSGLNLQFAFLALLQLVRQLKSRRAKARDDLYAACGPELTAEQLQPLQMGLEYADWAYDEDPSGKPLKELLDEQGYALLKHDKTAVPGALGHYVAISRDPKNKTALIGVKGTSNFEDLLVDMCGAAVPYELDAPFVKDGMTSFRAHDGILLSSKKLADDLQPLIENLLLPRGYKIQVVGHSLGAASAATVAIFLRSRIDKLRNDEEGNLLSVLAFASPPNLDFASALACKSFCTTIVNNVDVIPRSNIAPLLASIKVMKDINRRLEAKGLSATDIKSTAALVKKLGEGNGGELIMTADELAESVDASMTAVGLDDPDHLYVPGQVYLLYDDWQEEVKHESPTRPSTGNKTDLDEAGDYQYAADHAVVTNGTATPLRSIEWDGRLIDDHMAGAYRDSLSNLARKYGSPESVK